MKIKFLIAFCTLALITGCTENSRARRFGGISHIKLPANQKLLTVTWKDHDLFYLYRPMRTNEFPEITTFQENSNFGIMQGQVIFEESRN